MKFGKLILRKINKVVATRCHILRLKCTKVDFNWEGREREKLAPKSFLSDVVPVISETFISGIVWLWFVNTDAATRSLNLAYYVSTV